MYKRDASVRKGEKQDHQKVIGKRKKKEKGERSGLSRRGDRVTWFHLFFIYLFFVIDFFPPKIPST